MQFKDIDIKEFGNGLGQAGVLFTGGGRQYLILQADAIEGVDYKFDRELENSSDKVFAPDVITMTLPEWDALNQQLDNQLIETTDPNDHNRKIIVRKGQRAMDAAITWQVFERDDFRCRYCARRCPLTVDHIDLWELGGPTVKENLLAACRKCNKERGNMPYGAWLTSPYYKKVSATLTLSQREANEDVLQSLPELEKLRHTRYQGKRGS